MKIILASQSPRRREILQLMDLPFEVIESHVKEVPPAGAFLPRSKCLLISWLKSPSSVIQGPKKIKSIIVSIVSPSVCHAVMGLDAMILVF